MTISINNALAAYQNTLKNSGIGGAQQSGQQFRGFADMVKSAADDVIATNRNAEMQSAQAVQGTADLGQVVTAVASAELSLQTVVAVRDKVLEAYNEVLKMPV
ncbi:MAG: flagellar hook-basal body complex protein FliE [Rhodospirillales bacterium]